MDQVEVSAISGVEFLFELYESMMVVFDDFVSFTN